MNCSQCRAKVEDDSRFCRHCGARMPSPSTATAASPPLEPPPERDVWHGRPALRGFAGEWALCAAVIAAILFLIFRFAAQGDALRGAAGWGALAIGLGLLARQGMVIAGVRYCLTTQRLILERGILTRVTDQTELIRVDDIRVRQGVFDRLLDTGSIEIHSSDETDKDLTLRSVDKPGAVADLLRQNLRLARGRQTLFVQNV